MNIVQSTVQQPLVGKSNNIYTGHQVCRNSLQDNKISFGSSKSERALKLLDGVIDTVVYGSEFNFINKMRFHTILNEALPALMVPDNYINHGHDSKVYKISEKYVAKIRRGHSPKNAIHVFNTTSLPNKRFQELDFYYGQPVVRVGKVEILKNATPTENHICCGTSYRMDGYSDKAEIAIQDAKFLPVCSEVPQESYDNLAANLKKMNSMTCRDMRGRKHTYVPDIINPNNLIISDGRFVLVDELLKVPAKNPNSIFTMLEPLLLKTNPKVEIVNVEENAAHKDARRKIFGKVLIATEKHDLPLDSPLRYPYSEWALNNMIGDYNILEAVKNMRKQNVPLNERIAFIEETVLS